MKKKELINSIIPSKSHTENIDFMKVKLATKLGVDKITNKAHRNAPSAATIYISVFFQKYQAMTDTSISIPKRGRWPKKNTIHRRTRTTSAIGMRKTIVFPTAPTNGTLTTEKSLSLAPIIAPIGQLLLITLLSSLDY